jgi:hypothetical protein
MNGIFYVLSDFETGASTEKHGKKKASLRFLTLNPDFLSRTELNSEARNDIRPFL